MKTLNIIYIDDCKDEQGFMRATTCLQSHEDTLRANPIKAIEYSDYEQVQQNLNSLIAAVERYLFTEYSSEDFTKGEYYSENEAKKANLKEVLLKVRSAR